jgi:lysophospholipase L1-like esterase
VGHAVAGSMYLTYQGQQMSPWDALAASGVNKVFILLGMNDIGLYGVDKTIENWGILIGKIRESCPDIQIYIQSGTPIYHGGEKGKLTNANMNAYNVKLQAFAEENGCYYVDIATTMKDSNGALKANYCSDEYVHLTDAGCDAWALVLKRYVGE